ncbi:D-aminoacylase [Roseisolibacter sp. H3M3-2]|uniref:N-acyl-D-amino-acid deacylase family protein n=1 Tax=Roseisolibacter sp. H3M3-2 TaxID=3031323 RepID=UPI0023DB4691|nr:D-aminoacylase [Roseisolibacter sp. H3M3-2]MDF1504781.1 D-aminoacylase [Roseisolibacter sp. H3M3-2]
MSLLRSLAALALAASAAAAQAPADAYDVVIRNGRVLDGAGNPWVRADVGIRGDRIAAVGDLSGARAARVIDAAGRYVAPGFIDTHSHAGPGLASAALSGAAPLLAQGITTAVVNPDGGGPTDLAAQRGRLEAARPGVNVGLMVPHGSVRGAVLGAADRQATPAEMDRMRALVRAGMEAGAFGLSSGPFYAPGSYASTEELVALAREAGARGGVYQSHIRDESDYTVGVEAAVDEVIRVAREGRLPGVVTHIKALGPNVWGKSASLVARIDAARAAGVEVWADQYPYEASGTSLSASLLPRWAEAGGRDSLRARMADPATRDRLRRDMAANLQRRGGPARLQFQRYAPDPSLEGKNLQQAAEARGADPLDVALDMIGRGGAGVTSFNMDSTDIATLMRQPWTMTASDGDLVPMHQGVPHPRAYGTFPRKLGKYARDERTVGLEHAVRSMTGLPAAVFRVRDRGAIRPGAYADVVVFDLAAVRDPATYTQPHRLAEGMAWVLVNGRVALEDGRATDARAGAVLRR